MKLPYFLIFLFVITSSFGQSDKDQIMKPIHDLFTGMMKGDSALVHTAFTDDATMVSVGKDRNGIFSIRRQTIEPFLKAIGTPHDEIWQEPIWDIKIESDNMMAQVWVKYAFYIGKKFSHCGVDAFQLANTTQGWKIFHLADTRQRENCEIPEDIKSKFN